MRDKLLTANDNICANSCLYGLCAVVVMWVTLFAGALTFADHPAQESHPDLLMAIAL